MPSGRRGRDPLLGDSQIKYGLQPRVIENALNQTAYNLSIIAGQAPGSYFQLRRALAAGARPRAVVLDFEPILLRMPFNARPWMELLSPHETIELSWRTRDANFFTMVILGRSLPSYHWRSDLRAALLAAFHGQSISQRWNVAVARRNFDANRGANVMPADGAFRVGDDILERHFCNADWRPDPANVSFVRAAC